MFQKVFPSFIRSSKLHIQRQIFVRPLLLPAASLARLAAGSSNGLYVQFWAPDDGRKTRLKHVERLTEINKLWNFATCWLYSENNLDLIGLVFMKINIWTFLENLSRSSVFNKIRQELSVLYLNTHLRVPPLIATALFWSRSCQCWGFEITHLDTPY